MQPETPDEGLRIGAWRLLPSLNLLRRGGEEVRLEPRHVDLLVYLARRPGEVVSAEQILDDVWRGQVVGDNSVYQAMARLRRALGDDAQNPTYIETVPKRGYRLIAAIHQMPSSDAEATPQHGPNAVSPPRWWPSWWPARSHCWLRWRGGTGAQPTHLLHHAPHWCCHSRR